MLIREARPDDWPAVARLLAQLGRPDVRDTDDEQPARDVFLRYLERTDTVALVAEDEGRAIGFLDMEFRTRLNFLPPQAWIPDLVVDEEGRRRGVGRALISRAEELARDRACWGMTLESATWRVDAHRFYEREGWKEGGKSFGKNLTGVAWPPAPPDAPER